MEQKNRAVFSLAVILLIFCALLVSFGRSLFSLDTPDVVLPDVGSSSAGETGTPGQSGPLSDQAVAVTPKTVQSVIATLERSDSYYREMTIEQFWGDSSDTTTIQVWMDGDWSHIRQLLPNGAGRHDLVGPETVYYWYDGSSRYETTPADSQSSDLAQRLPTYEMVLDLPPESITDAGYQLLQDSPCVYVEAENEEFSTTKRYWVSVDSGLLVCAETLHGENLLYRMTAFTPIQSPCPASASFELPDGTVLHTP